MLKEKLIKKHPLMGKLAFFIGASMGIGKAIAKDFVQLGSSVLIIARRQNFLQEAAKEMRKQISDESQIVEIISCDATDMEKLKPLLEDFIKKYGVPDYLFNFVGHSIPG